MPHDTPPLRHLCFDQALHPTVCNAATARHLKIRLTCQANTRKGAQESAGFDKNLLTKPHPDSDIFLPRQSKI